jgi:hypothetical protein
MNFGRHSGRRFVQRGAPTHGVHAAVLGRLRSDMEHHARAFPRRLNNERGSVLSQVQVWMCLFYVVRETRVEDFGMCSLAAERGE